MIITMDEKQTQLSNARQNNLAEFTVMTSAHGSVLGFDKPLAEIVPKNLIEAVRESDNFEREWDAYGGKTQIYHLPTALTFHYDKALATIQKPFVGQYLAEKYLSGAGYKQRFGMFAKKEMIDKLNKRLEHTEGVAQFALKVARRVSERNPSLNLSLEFVGWLGYVHDIGYSVEDAKHEVHTIELLTEQEGVSADIARYAMHGQLAEQFGEAEGNVDQYLPLGLEGRILTYADMSVRVGEPIPMRERAKEIIDRIRGIPSMPVQLKQDIETNMYKALPRFESYESEILSLAGLTAAKDF